jgi:spore coat polysaccharide biosynthesis protein SpsF
MYKTEQEKFWEGEFGNNYIQRNNSSQLLASNINFFTKALNQSGRIDSCIEFGANIGMNLKALKLLYPNLKMSGVEINKKASEELATFIGHENVFNGSIFEYSNKSQKDLSLIKTVLIHVNPEMLDLVYDKLYKSSKRFILIAEYYNPTPVSIKYRGHENKLFKRDFAGDFLKKFPDTKLIDYGFIYKGDIAFPEDDITWFLIEK